MVSGGHLPYHKGHRYVVSADSQEMLQREAPFLVALIEASGSRLTQCAKGILDVDLNVSWPITVEVGLYSRLTLPIALICGTAALVGMVVGQMVVLGTGAVIAASALYIGRTRFEEWTLRLDERTETVDDIIANASLSHDVPHRFMRMADYLLLTDQGRYLWDTTTYRIWETQGSPQEIRTFGLTATVEGQPVIGEPLRALQIGV